MSYKIGQFSRLNSVSSNDKLAVSSMSYSSMTLQTRKDHGSERWTDTGIMVSSNLQEGGHYILRFSVNRPTTYPIDFQVVLFATDAPISGGNYRLTQYIDDYVRLAPRTTGYATTEKYEYAFSPRELSNGIGFIISRTSYDYMSSVSSERTKLSVNITELSQPANLLDSVSGVDSVKKIGIQGSETQLFLLNTSGFRVGRSGQLEINCGVPITFIGICNTLPYIIDYAYEA